jgi:glycosyltransferase involved in cell wall biosynthesis
MARLLIISTHFPPENGAGTHRIIRFTKHLRAYGWDIAVLTMHPHYYAADTRMDEALLTQVPQDIVIYRTKAWRGMTALIHLRNYLRSSGNVRGHRPKEPTPATRMPPSLWQRLKDTLSEMSSVPDTEIGWLGHAVRRGIAIIRRHHSEVILSSAPPFTCHLVAGLLSRCCGVKWVADLRDPWSRAPWARQEMAHSWKGHIHRWLEWQTIHRADAVILNTQPMSDEFKQHYGSALAEKFYVVTNGYDEELVEPYRNQLKHHQEKLIITHVGSLYRERNPHSILQALSLLIQKGSIPANSVELHLVGAISKQFPVQQMVSSLNLQSVVHLTPTVSHSNSLKCLAQSSVLLVIQPGTHLQVPVKLYEYIAFRKPILALAPAGAVADIVQQGNLGIVADPDDVEAIAQALSQLYEHRHRLTEAFPYDEGYLQQFDGNVLSARLQEILAKVSHA